MKQMLQQAQMIFFDMDGTLYEGRKHYDTYAQQLMLQVPKNKQESFWHNYTQAMNKQLPLKPGTIFLKQSQNIIQVDPFTLSSIFISDWNGNRVYESIHIKDLPSDRYIPVGDAWWIAYVCAVQAGSSPDFSAYEKTKEIMLTAQYNFPKTKNLKESLSRLKSKQKIFICITNSYAEDAKSLLKFLGLYDVFMHIVAPGNKPQEIKNHFYRYLNLYHLKPEQTLSIGDNIFNEIIPALQMGMPAILLSDWGEDYTHPRLKIVPTLENIFD